MDRHPWRPPHHRPWPDHGAWPAGHAPSPCDVAFGPPAMPDSASPDNPRPLAPPPRDAASRPAPSRDATLTAAHAAHAHHADTILAAAIEHAARTATPPLEPPGWDDAGDPVPSTILAAALEDPAYTAELAAAATARWYADYLCPDGVLDAVTQAALEDHDDELTTWCESARSPDPGVRAVARLAVWDVWAWMVDAAPPRG